MVILVKHIFLALPNDLKMESKILSVVFLKESTQIPAQKNNKDAWRTHGDVVSDFMYCFYVSIVDLEQENAGYSVSKKDLTKK